MGSSDGLLGGAPLEMELVQAQVYERLFGERTPAVTIGRFEVVAPAGAGGMGVVFVAIDPELGRRVALKLVSQADSGSTPSSQARLLGEAQTLARLSHPNIVAVHEVGTFEGRVYLAMEHIEGETLERWLDRSPRPRHPEILRAFVQAGRGLAAAHRAGVVHGDFKPSNAMIDRAGRVRVLDFGLAIAERAQDGSGDASGAAGRTVASRGGTPRFMSLEQWRSQPATTLSDQYSFCVSLWVAMYGVHPFAGDGEDAMLAAMGTRTVRPSSTRGVPGWLRRALLRGLDPSPAQRWPSMDTLADVLEHGPARARRRRLSIALAGVATIGLVIAGLRALEHRRAIAACEQAGDELAAPWDDARASVLDAIASSGVAYAAVTVEKLEPHLAAYAAQLREVGQTTCRAGEVERELDPELYLRARACLADRHDALGVLLVELGGGDPDTVRTAVMGALGLPEVGSCASTERLASLPQPPPEARDEVRAVRAELARVRVLQGAGRSEDARVVIDRSGARAIASGWAPVIAEHAIERAELLHDRGDERTAEIVAHEAYLEAARVGAWDVAARAAALQLATVGVGLGRYDEAMLWNQLAELAEVHAGQPEGLLTAGRLDELAVVHYVSADPAASKAVAEQALAIETRILGEGHPRMRRSLAQLGDAHLALADYEQARELYGRVLALDEEAFGGEHPTTAQALVRLGMVEFYTGNLERGRELATRGVAQLQRALEPGHAALVGAEANLGILEGALGEYTQARARFERLVPAMERIYGPEHAQVAVALSNLANTYFYVNSYDAAMVLMERALAIEEVALGPRHPDVAKSLSTIASIYHQKGRSTEALRLRERAIAIDEAALGPDHPEVAVLLRNLAGTYRDLGDLQRAIPLIERAIAILEAKDGVQMSEPASQFMLALMLVDTGGDRDRAIELAERAVVGYRALHHDDKVELAEGWLAEQRAAR